MALGSAAVAWGVQNGFVSIGVHIVFSSLVDHLPKRVVGSVSAAATALAAATLGSIGIAALGSAVAIPALAVVTAGSIFAGAIGYTSADLFNEFMRPQVDLAQFFSGASVALVGVALLLDGARRVLTDEGVLASVSRINDGVIYLSKLGVKIVARTQSEFEELLRELRAIPTTPLDAAGSAATATVGAAGGAVIGGAIAASSVTILGSQTLGAAAVSLGLVSAPVWPVVAIGAAGLGAGYVAWKTARFLAGKM